MTEQKLAPEDLFQLAMVGQTTIHPNGRHAICEIAHLNPETNQTVYHLWHVDVNGGERTPFTWGLGRERRPQYSPDGHFVAFLGQRQADDEEQLFVMRADGGEPMAVTHQSGGIESFVWHPNGQSFIYRSRVKPDEMKDESSWRSKYTKDVLVVDRTWYRLDGVGYFSGSRVHLFRVDITSLVKPHSLRMEAMREFSFPVRQLTMGQFDVCEYVVHPTGKSVVFVSNLEPDADQAQHRFAYQVSITEEFPVSDDVPAAEIRRLPIDLKSIHKLAYDAAGNNLALIGDNREEGQYTLANLYVFEEATQSLQNITEDLEVAFGNAILSDVRADVEVPVIWSEHARFVYTVASENGTAQLVRIRIDEQSVEWLTKGRHTVLTFDLNRDRGTAVLLIEDAARPADLYVQNIPLSGETGTLPRALTNVNAGFFHHVDVSMPKVFNVDDELVPVQGWVLLPTTPEPEGGYPTVVQVHGGPVAAYGESYFFEFQLLAMSGIAVIYCNPRGSLGYGQSFCSAIRGTWGQKDFYDVERFVDAALEAYPLNPKRLAIAGGSYGGFMAAHAIGHTQRYKAAVVMRACVNEYSMFGTCDIGFMDIEDLGVAPWEDPKRYANLSPIAAADKMSASVLIIHAEDDLRCPIEQAEQLYAALKYHDVPVRFVRFPEEGHNLSRSGKPWHRVARLEHIVQFLREQLAE